jgi:hypothetical protein
VPPAPNQLLSVYNVGEKNRRAHDLSARAFPRTARLASTATHCLQHRASPPRAHPAHLRAQPDYASVPPLPPVKSVDPATYMGPTEESNWVIYPRLLVGAYPSSVHDATNTSILSSILRLGATTFVCLQQEYQHEGVLEHEWRSGAKLRPYIFDAIKLIDKLPASFFPADRGKPSGLEFVHFPIQGACARSLRSVVYAPARALPRTRFITCPAFCVSFALTHSSLSLSTPRNSRSRRLLDCK